MKNIQKSVYKLTCYITVISMLIILQTSNIVFAENSELSEKQFSFWVISDLHSGSWDGYFQQPKIRAALTDIKETDPDTSAIITNGDNVESNTDGCWEQLVKAINDTIGDSIPMYFTIGNHELKVEEGGTYNEELERYFKYTNSVSADDTIDSVFYAHKINGQYFIHLGSQSQNETGQADLHQDQLAWLEGALNRADKEGVRAYVFIHQPLKNTVSGTRGEIAGYDVIIQDSELREILDAHPNVLVFSGDTHIHLEYPNQALLGGREKPSYFNDGAIGKMSSIENGAWTDYEGSQGLCVEVYNDKILVRGRDFANKQWISSAQSEIDIGDNKSEEKPQLEVEFIDESGNRLNDFNSIASADNVKVHIPMLEAIKENNKAVAVAVFYDSDGRCIKLCTEEITDFSKDIEFSMGEAIEETGGNIKVFVWDSLSSMKPLCKSAGI